MSYNKKLDNSYSLVRNKVFTLKSAPFDEPLILLSDWKHREVTVDGDFVDLTIKSGSVFTKLSEPVTKLITWRVTDEGSLVYPITPSKFLVEDKDIKTLETTLTVHKNEGSDVSVIPLKSKIINLSLNSKEIRSDDAISLSDLMMFKIVISDPEVNRNDLDYVFSLNRDMSLKLTVRISGRVTTMSETYRVDWIGSPIQNAQRFINEFKNTFNYITTVNCNIENQYKMYKKNSKKIDYEDFNKKLFELVDNKVIRSGALTPTQTGAYLLEYIGLSAFDSLVELYINKNFESEKVNEILKILPNNLFSYKEVLKGEHRRQKTNNIKTSVKSIFN